MGIVLSNNAASLLAADISAITGTMTITPGDGIEFPDPSSGDYFYCTLIGTDGSMEIVKVTDRTIDVFTIVRAQENTTAKAFPTGTLVELRVTAQTILDAVDTAVADVTLDDFGVTASSAEINILDGATLSTAELNILDGATLSTAELNILDGVVASSSDFNKLVGLVATSSELNKLAGTTATVSDFNKLAAVTASASELNKLAGATPTTSEINKLSGLTASTAELNKLAGVTATTTEINYLSGVTSNIQTQINSFATFPAGAIIPYAGSAAPTGWALCQGQAISRTTFATLFAVIGTTYGAGNGSTTFNVPDLRGRVVAGKDDMGGVAANRLTGTSGGVTGSTLGASGGTETHLLTVTEIPAHSHVITYDRESPQGGSGDNAAWNLRATGGAYSGTTTSVGGGAAHNNVQPTLIMNYIIKT
ncbi:MAG: tail fiber protein [Armatimonadia bacterium]